MSDDAMVPIADLLSRSEALTVAAMLDAAGIIVHVGGEYYAGTTLNIVAIGGFRLTVPASQYADASAILRDFAAEPGEFIEDLRRRTIKVLAIVWLTIGVPLAFINAQAGSGVVAMVMGLMAPLATTPASPQGRGDYYLAPAPVD
jgi:chromosome segregation and condensation protein ScpB